VAFQAVSRSDPKHALSRELRGRNRRPCVGSIIDVVTLPNQKRPLAVLRSNPRPHRHSRSKRSRQLCLARQR
jgi:hypothetical protein